LINVSDGGAPIPRQQFFEFLDGMFGDARENVGEPGLRVTYRVTHSMYGRRLRFSAVIGGAPCKRQHHSDVSVHQRPAIFGGYDRICLRDPGHGPIDRRSAYSLQFNGDTSPKLGAGP